jgi:hypothetical protein
MGNVTSSAAVVNSDAYVVRSVSSLKCVVTTWAVPDGRFWAGSLAHCSKTGATYVASGSVDQSRDFLRVYDGVQPSVITPVSDFHQGVLSSRVLLHASSIMFVSPTRHNAGHRIVVSVGNIFYAVSHLSIRRIRQVSGGLLQMDQSPFTPMATVAATYDSRGRIAQIMHNICAVYLHTLHVPLATCMHVGVMCSSDEECPEPYYAAPTIISTIICGDRNISIWTRLVAIAFDSEDRLYVLDVNVRTVTLWRYDPTIPKECALASIPKECALASIPKECALASISNEWTLAADLTTAYKDVQIAGDDSFALVVDAFRQRAFVAHATCVHVTQLDHVGSNSTTCLLAGHPYLQGQTNGSRNEASFASLRGCALRTSPLDHARDIAPVVSAIRMATVADATNHIPWPVGIADIVEQYARGFGDPAIGLLLSDYGNRAVRQLNFTT